MSARTLADDLALLAEALRAQAAHPRGSRARAAAEAVLASEPSPALARVAARLGLTPFERATLLLAASVELDGSFAGLCAAAQGLPPPAPPTFGLALALFPSAEWAALLPSAPLRRWGLAVPTPGASLTGDPLVVEERVLHELAGVPALDARLAACLAPAPAPAPALPPGHVDVAARVAAAWTEWEGEGPPPFVQLVGPDAEDKVAIVGALCRHAGVEARVLPLDALPAGASEADAFARAWAREAALSGAVLLVDAHAGRGEPAREAALRRLASRLDGALALAVEEPIRVPGRASRVLDVANPSPAEQAEAWRAVVDGPLAEELAGRLDLSASRLREAVQALAAHPAPSRREAAWEASRGGVRPALDDLATRVVPRVRLSDVVLPPAQAAALRRIRAQARHRVLVHERWGFAAGGARGLGLTVLFAGESGTGKTMAAEALAGELGLDLYRVDLSQVVSKYVGETEKGLRRVFAAAEPGGVALLFDEADALFGKRTEVRDSHDRYANQEVSYLLQRMESYRGLAILTTNLKDALDPAFARRLRHVLSFPFPDAAARAELWRRAFPREAPTEGIDADRLARIVLSGGHIRNVALDAAFLAAEAGEPIRMRHVLDAARAELAKLERPMADVEVAA